MTFRYHKQNHCKIMKPVDVCFLILFASVAIGNAAEYHVSISCKNSNLGSVDAPVRTIQHAAELAQPGDIITVHAGIYRERIDPPRGGLSDSRRITYQAASGETVEIAGSEVVKEWTKMEGNVWKTVIPNRFFGTFNPYQDENLWRLLSCRQWEDKPHRLCLCEYDQKGHRQRMVERKHWPSHCPQ